MVHGMTRSAVQNWAIGNIFSIMNEHRPDLYEEEQAQVCELL